MGPPRFLPIEMGAAQKHGPLYPAPLLLGALTARTSSKLLIQGEKPVPGFLEWHPPPPFGARKCLLWGGGFPHKVGPEEICPCGDRVPDRGGPPRGRNENDRGLVACGREQPLAGFVTDAVCGPGYC